MITTAGLALNSINNSGLDLKAAMAVAVGEVEINDSRLRFSTMAENTIRGATWIFSFTC